MTAMIDFKGTLTSKLSESDACLLPWENHLPTHGTSHASLLNSKGAVCRIQCETLKHERLCL